MGGWEVKGERTKWSIIPVEAYEFAAQGGRVGYLFSYEIFCGGLVADGVDD